ncbi:GntR family transcriptional regulator [Microbacterium gorillae]|uniref:GntR family transcriptional regulator n=1 Tax=Microbacterium gorillae TaxID=1231063 RepID=UPI00058D8A10|nr:GntR family transcriptional regulator [Microbacterium gorillae]
MPIKTLPAPRTSKSEHAYRWIRDGIASHRFGPGYRLVLGSVADELQMSVVPVREAIRRLEAEGLVTFERNVGARVTLVDARDYVDTMESLGIIEGAATALAAPLLSEEQLARAEQINARMAALLPTFDPHSFTVLNQEFHATLFEGCPNAHLLELVERDWSRLAGLRDSTFAFVPDRAAHSVREHTELIALIRTAAPGFEIEQAARAHRTHTLQAYREARGLTEDTRLKEEQ